LAAEAPTILRRQDWELATDRHQPGTVTLGGLSMKDLVNEGRP
jgi:hypothetical protein